MRSLPADPQLHAPSVVKLLRDLLVLLVIAFGILSVQAQSDLASLQTQAENGDPVAMNTLGNMYANGQGVTRDDAEALRQYNLSAERAYAPANFNLGMMYELGRGVTADITKAFSYYVKAAQQGFAPAQFNVGNMYAGGLGVEQDDFEAVLWFRQAADQGVSEAQYNLGLAYELGRGVAKDPAQAQVWYALSAKQGYARANYNLAVMKEEGRGSEVDEAEAAKLYLTASQQGFGPAQNNYGIMLAEGRGGLTPDPIEALVWLNIAVENGINPLGRDLVAKQLTPAQLAEVASRLETMRNGAASATTAQTQAPVAAATPAAVDARVLEQLQGLKAENKRVLALQQRTEEERIALNARLQTVVTENKKLSAKIDTINQSLATAQKDPSADPKIVYLMAENTRLNDEVTRSTKELSSLFRKLRIANDKVRSMPSSSGAGSAPDQSSLIATLRQDLARLRTENRRLVDENSKRAVGDISPSEIQALRDKVAEGERAKADLAAISNNVATLTSELETTKQARDAAIAAQADLESKLALAIPAEKPDEAETQRLNEVIAQTKSALASSRREVAELQVQLTATKADFKAGSAEARSKIAETKTVARQLEESNQQLTAQVQSLQKDLAAQSHQPISTVDPTRVKNLESELNTSRLAANKLKDQLTNAESERSRLARENEAAQVHLAQLQQDLAKRGGDAKQVAKLQAELSASRASVSSLSQQLSDAESEHNRLARTQTDTQNLVATLRQQLDAAQVNQRELQSSLQPKLDAANAHLASQQTALSQLETTNRNLELSAKDLKRQNESLTDKNRKLAAGNQSNAAQSSLAAVEKAKLSAEIDEAARVIAEHTATINNFKVQVSSLESDLDNSRKSAAAALAAQAEATQALPDAQATLMEIKTLQAQVGKMENQLAKERAQSADAMAQLADQLKLASATNKSLSDANRSLIMNQNANTESLQADLKLAQTRAEELAAINASLAEERDQQRAQFDDLVTKRAALEQQVADLEQAKSTAEIVATKAQTELQNLQAKYSASDTALNQQSGTVAELTGLNENLTKEKLFLETQLAQSQSQKKQAQNELEQLRTQNEEQNHVATAQTSEANTRAEMLQAKLDEATTQIADLVSENTRLTSANAGVTDLQAQLTATQNKLDEATGVAQSQVARESQLVEEKSSLTQRLKLATDQLDSLRSENSRLAATSKALVEANSRIDGLTAALAQFNIIQKDLTAAKAENTRLKQTAFTLERDRTTMIASLKQENTALSRRLRQAQGTLDQIASAARYVNSSGVTNNTRSTPRAPTRASTLPASTPRIHIVVEGDSLSRISMRYFGTANRWQEIYEANRAVLSAENVLRPGQQLKIP